MKLLPYLIGVSLSVKVHFFFRTAHPNVKFHKERLERTKKDLLDQVKLLKENDNHSVKARLKILFKDIKSFFQFWLLQLEKYIILSLNFSWLFTWKCEQLLFWFFGDERFALRWVKNRFGRRLGFYRWRDDDHSAGVSSRITPKRKDPVSSNYRKRPFRSRTGHYSSLFWSRKSRRWLQARN